MRLMRFIGIQNALFSLKYNYIFSVMRMSLFTVCVSKWYAQVWANYCQIVESRLYYDTIHSISWTRVLRYNTFDSQFLDCIRGNVHRASNKIFITKIIIFLCFDGRIEEMNDWRVWMIHRIDIFSRAIVVAIFCK